MKRLVSIDVYPTGGGERWCEHPDDDAFGLGPHPELTVLPAGPDDPFFFDSDDPLPAPLEDGLS